MANEMNIHKMNAMGKDLKMKAGGAVPYIKSGKPTSPLTDAKRANGIPGFKSGGKVKAKGKC